MPKNPTAAARERAVTRAKNEFSAVVDRRGLGVALEGVLAYCVQFDQPALAERLGAAVDWWKRNDDSGD